MSSTSRETEPSAEQLAEGLCRVCDRRIRRSEAFRRIPSEQGELLFCCPMCWSAYDAGEVQRRLIAAPYAEKRIRISVDYEPALQVGGDYAHISPRGEDRVSVAIGDVTGHGIKPSLVVGRISGEVEALAALDLSPAEVASSLHRTLGRLFEGQNVYMTFFAASIDLATRTITYVNCGHPPALLWRAEASSFELLAAHHVPLGLTDDETFGSVAVVEVAYRAGDGLVLYTDGITEGLAREDDDQGLGAFAGIAREVLLEGGGSLLEKARSRMAATADDDLLTLFCELL